jgi:hypothetical protein
MTLPIANRNDDQYSSDMETAVEMLPIVTHLFPVTWRHLDDDTNCDAHEVCPRTTYARGGRNGFGFPPILAE